VKPDVRQQARQTTFGPRFGVASMQTKRSQLERPTTSHGKIQARSVHLAWRRRQHIAGATRTGTSLCTQQSETGLERGWLG